MTPMLLTILLACGTLFVLSICMSWILGWANRAFHVHVDPKITAIDAALPGANCGGCGFVGCTEYAEAVAKGDTAIDLCAPGGQACVDAIAGIMGVAASDKLPYKAVVHCGATRDQRLQQGDYRGEQSCQAANLVGGVQGCTYGCLGFGDCAVACEYDAIDIFHGLAIVDQAKCVGCKACVSACPRNIISMVPYKSDKMLILACANKDRGKDVKSVCTTGCLGCKACTKVQPDLVSVENNLAKVDYDKFDPSGFTHEELVQLNEKCPMERFAYAGRKPSAKELIQVADEAMPARAEANFKTTVDKLDWWG